MVDTKGYKMNVGDTVRLNYMHTAATTMPNMIIEKLTGGIADCVYWNRIKSEFTRDKFNISLLKMVEPD